jgi:uncharacterized membrane protein (DUF106 family)
LPNRDFLFDYPRLIMEEFLDMLWLKIVVGVQFCKHILDVIFGPLNALGPAVAIAIIALITVIITKILSKRFKTRRYKELRKQFEYWLGIRQEAQKCKDPDKARLLTKNIDQAKLNKLYYDYFFEGLLNNLATTYLPIFTLLAYINEAYRSTNLAKLFERDYIFKFGGDPGQPVLIGAVFWFVLSLFLIYLAWYIVQKIYARYAAAPAEQASE